jgi:hypothetical protein
MYPHFLVIGAQKAGTTWLDRNLRTHPQIWLPPEKEIHFFDLPLPFPFAALQYAPGHAVRHWARHRLQRDLAKVERGEQSAEWYGKYYYSLRSWSWYRSLFTPGEGQIAGEATPRYAVLPKRKIASIRHRIPNLKIIYLLRDPIDRMWSDLAMFHDQRFGGPGTHAVLNSTESRFLENPGHLRHSRYAENLARWGGFFRKEQIHVCFLADLASKPREVLEGLFLFLNVDPAHQPPDGVLLQKINHAAYPGIPDSAARRLASSLVADARKLDSLLATGQTAAWVRRMDSLLAGGGKTAQ